MADTDTSTPFPRAAWAIVWNLAAERLAYLERPDPSFKPAVTAIRDWLDTLAVDGLKAPLGSDGAVSLDDYARAAAAMAIAPEPPEETPEDAEADALVFGLATEAPFTAQGTLCLMGIQALGRKAPKKNQRALYDLAAGTAVHGGRVFGIGSPEWAALASFARRRGLFEED